jgi:hypothetical protein
VIGPMPPTDRTERLRAFVQGHKTALGAAFLVWFSLSGIIASSIGPSGLAVGAVAGLVVFVAGLVLPHWATWTIAFVLFFILVAALP